MAYVVDAVVTSNGGYALASGDIQIVTGSIAPLNVDSGQSFTITYNVQNVSQTDYSQVYGYIYLTGDSTKTPIAGSSWTTSVPHGQTVAVPGTPHAAITGDLNLTIEVGHIEGGGEIPIPDPVIPGSGGTGNSIWFYGRATGGTPPYTWLWDFGDGTTSTSQDIQHAFATDGTYTVTLTVTDNASQSASVSQDIVISAGGGGFAIDPMWLLIGSAAIGGTILVAVLLSRRKPAGRSRRR